MKTVESFHSHAYILEKSRRDSTWVTPGETRWKRRPQPINPRDGRLSKGERFHRGDV
ncbi:MAG TPA: hypothetical protein VKM36_07960 [Balneolaceae bacterium]|nr:hypothetical protein [Balneolaceae bacterium]